MVAGILQANCENTPEMCENGLVADLGADNWYVLHIIFSILSCTCTRWLTSSRAHRLCKEPSKIATKVLKLSPVWSASGKCDCELDCQCCETKCNGAFSSTWLCYFDVEFLSFRRIILSPGAHQVGCERSLGQVFRPLVYNAFWCRMCIIRMPFSQQNRLALQSRNGTSDQVASDVLQQAKKFRRIVLPFSLQTPPTLFLGRRRSLNQSWCWLASIELAFSDARCCNLPQRQFTRISSVSHSCFRSTTRQPLQDHLYRKEFGIEVECFSRSGTPEVLPRKLYLHLVGSGKFCIFLGHTLSSSLKGFLCLVGYVLSECRFRLVETDTTRVTNKTLYFSETISLRIINRYFLYLAVKSLVFCA